MLTNLSVPYDNCVGDPIQFHIYLAWHSINKLWNILCEYFWYKAGNPTHLILFCCQAADVYCKLLKVVCILQNSYFFYSETVFVPLSFGSVRVFKYLWLIIRRTMCRSQSP